jgi:hypothetical protein
MQTDNYGFTSEEEGFVSGGESFSDDIFEKKATAPAEANADF